MDDPPEALSPEADERLQRRLSEMLQETRVVMPGVQVLFGFLLAVPFQQRFGHTSSFQRDVYLIAVLLSAAATVCFIAPTAYHRILFRYRDKSHLIKVGNSFLIAGIGFLALAMTAAVLLVTDALFSTTTVIVVAVLLTTGFAWFWLAFPLLRRIGRARAPD